MYRKSFVVLTVLFMSGSALAQQGFYAGVGFGKAEVTSKDVLIAIPQGDNILDRFKVDDSSLKIHAGYRFNKYFGLEGTLQDFGDPDAFSTGILDAMGDDIFVTVETTTMQLAALGFLPIGDGVFNIFGRIGVTAVDEKFRFSGVAAPVAVPYARVNNDRDGRNTLLAYGFGVQLNLLANKNLILRVEWEQTQADAVERYDYIGATLGFKFGDR